MAKKNVAFDKHDIREFQHEYLESIDGNQQTRRSHRTAAKDIQIKATVYHEVIVKVDSNLVDTIETNIGILYKDPTFEMYENLKICAEVVAVPGKLRGSVLYEEDPGWPQPLGRKGPDGKLTQSTYRRQFKTLAGTEVRVQKGDFIYFHYLTLTDQNYIGKDTEGMELYKCGYDQIFCRVIPFSRVVKSNEGIPIDHQKGRLIEMINGYIAVKPFYGEGYEEVEVPELDVLGNDLGKTRTLRVKQSESGIIYDINEKPTYRTGIIEHLCSPSPDGKDYGLRVGDKVVYTHNREFKNTIEGTEYYLMQLWHVVAVYRNGKIVPIGDRVLIDTLQKAETKLILPASLKAKPNEGVVLAVGHHVTEVMPGDKVYFQYNETYYLELPNFRGAFMKENHIVYKWV